MENEEKLVVILPGDKILITTNRPVKFYYRAVDVDDVERTFSIEL